MTASADQHDARDTPGDPPTPYSISIVDHRLLTALLDTTPERTGERRVDITWNPPRPLDPGPDPDPPPGDDPLDNPGPPGRGEPPGNVGPPLPDAA
ncbi:hypothetical protein [Gordonia otitidis]|uniref:Uncharacterized protein n=1 Tax=Gordonia otitidis (strain DSM 44809 / CCUG 52243 / JCM 12355 / NBRC 100426 / IFM 10032) TaxID=1108044 RepID=H5TGT9_GORO1|nr:hypothetical protein [Gordonia otitidis]GAB32697.1 hypothetical protein GOOTI_024_00010 [Gordonia otitidis NBRC 100426]